MIAYRSLPALLVLILGGAGCASAPDDGTDEAAGKQSVDDHGPMPTEPAADGAELAFTEPHIAPARVRFRIGASAVWEGEGTQLKATPVVSGGKRVMQLRAEQRNKDGELGLPLVYFQLEANGWAPGTITCATQQDAAFVVFASANSRSETVMVAADGTRSKRDCSVTIERADSVEDIDWSLLTGVPAPAAGTKRVLVRAHFHAEVGPKTGEGLTTVVEGAVDLWDDVPQQ